jgi:hypothetical protein
MRKLAAAMAMLFIASTLSAQTSSLTGTVSDTMEKKPLQYAVVSLLQKKDSTIYKFTRTDRSGRFLLSELKPGSYTLLITYPKFADYADEVLVKNEPSQAGSIALTQRAHLLQAVIIKSAGAIRIKGDTT